MAENHLETPTSAPVLRPPPPTGPPQGYLPVPPAPSFAGQPPNPSRMYMPGYQYPVPPGAPPMSGQFQAPPGAPVMPPGRPPMPMGHYPPVMGAHPHMPAYPPAAYPAGSFRPPPFGSVGPNPGVPGPPADKQDAPNGKKKRAFMIDTLTVKSKLSESSAPKPTSEEPKLGKRAPKKSQLDSMLLMEDLQKDSKFYGNLFFPPDQSSRNNMNMENPEAMKFSDVLREMKEQPSKYFNFGFNMQDYLSFVAKHYFVRLERNIILHSAENFGKQTVPGAVSGASSAASSVSSANHYSDNFTQNYQRAGSVASFQSMPAPAKP